MNLNKHIKTFEGFTGKYNTSPENALIVVDITVKNKLVKILKDLNPDSKDLVNEFIENADFRDLKDEFGKEKIKLPILLKKFDRKVTDVVLRDIDNHFKELNGGNAYVDIKKSDKYIPDHDKILQIMKDEYGYGDLPYGYMEEFEQTKDSLVSSDEEYAEKFNKFIKKN